MKNNGGRPSKYNTIDLKQVEKLAAYGLVDKEIADIMGICRATLANYKNGHQEFLDTIKKGKSISDAKVIESLYKRATGYEHDEDRIFQYEGEPVIVPTIKHYPPDPVSMIYWLCNRRPDIWKNIQKVEHSGQDGEPIKFIIKNAGTNGK